MKNGFDVFVIPPSELGPCKDPDEFIRKYGAGKYPTPIHAFRYWADQLVDGVNVNDDAKCVEVLGLAVNYAQAFNSSHHKMELKKFFWPTLLGKIGFNQQDVEEMVEEHRKARVESDKWNKYKVDLKDLNSNIKAGDTFIAIELMGKIHENMTTSAGTEPIRNLLHEKQEYDSLLKQRALQPMLGIAQVNLPTLDQKTSGLHGYITLAAPPNIGKTSLAIQLAIDAVMKNQNVCSLICSMEMPRSSIYNRLYCHLGGVTFKELTTGKVHPDIRAKVDGILSNIGSKIQILDSKNFPNPSAKGILKQAKALKKASGATRVIIIYDYLQVMEMPEHTKVLSEIDGDKWKIEQFKKVRDDLDPGEAIIVISEARKPNSGNQRWATDLSDVMGSARGTYTPDCVLLLRERGKGDNTKTNHNIAPKAGTSNMVLVIAKIRDGGEKGEIELNFDYKRYIFTEGFK
jgi:replicative DNA helicase